MYNDGSQYNSYDFNYEMASRHEYRGLKQNASKLGFLLILYALGLRFFQYVFLYILYFFLDRNFTLSYSRVIGFFRENQSFLYSDKVNISMNIFVVVCSLIMVLIVVKFVFKISISSFFKIEKKSVIVGVKAFPFSLLLNFIMTTIASYITYYFASFGVTIPDADFSTNVPSTSYTIMMFSYMVIIAPIVEELVYRGLVIKFLQPYGKSVAIFFSGFIFGLMHGNLSQFMSAFLTGILFATIAVYTGSIVPTIVMHVINNFLSFIVICGSDYNIDIVIGIYYFILISVLFIGILEIFLYRKIIKKRFADNSLLSKKKRYQAILTSIPMLVYLLMLVYDFIDYIFVANK